MYIDRMNKILEKNMSSNGYQLWLILHNKIKPVWNRSASSSKKYHKKENNYVPTIGEHTYEMLYAAQFLTESLNIELKSSDADVIFLAIALHDAFKYGINPNDRTFTDKNHDNIVADKVKANRDYFKKIMSEDQVNLLEETLRYHSGRWSPAAKGDKFFSISKLKVEILLVHFLDMMSSRNLIKISSEDI